MRYTKFGPTGMDVSVICLGCMSFGDPGRGKHEWSLPEAESREIIKGALDAGINFFDTANVYSGGSSEEITGRALADMARPRRDRPRDQGPQPMRAGPNGGGLSRKAILTEIDNSLRRLGTDYVDLYQIHRWDYETPIEETLEALQRRRPRRQGPLHRRLLDVRLAVREGAGHERAPRLGAASSRCRTTTTCSTARRSARCCRSAPPRTSA